jgi:WD40 repeat protein
MYATTTTAAATEGAASWDFRKKYIVGGPITCVSFLSQDIVLVAKGPYIEIVGPLQITSHSDYPETPPPEQPPVARSTDATAIWHHDQSHYRRHLVFTDGGSIHGARHPTNTNFIVLFGGRQIALIDNKTFQPIQVNDSNSIFAVGATDWIWDVRVHQKQRNSTNTDKNHDREDNQEFVFAFGLANNACELWNFTRPSSSSSTTAAPFLAYRTHRFVNQIACITYCMALHGWDETSSTPTTLIIASGTVFNEILLWTLAADDMILAGNSNDNDDKIASAHELPVVATLQGHEGVILSVKFNQEGNVLASTSDDRSVRLWRKTSETEWNLTWVGWGHTARVWDVTVTAHGVVSTGEDGTARLWDLQNGHQRHIFRHYGSQSIWRVDVLDDVAVLGTNDGSVKYWDLLQQCSQSRNIPGVDDPTEGPTIQIPDDRPPPMNESEFLKQKETDERTLADGMKKRKKPKLAVQVVLGMDFYHDSLDANCLAVATRAGSLFIFSLHRWIWKDREAWISEVDRTTVNPSEGNCMAISAHRIAAVGTTKGALVLHKMEHKSDNAILDGRVFNTVQNLSWLQLDLLAAFHIKGIIVLWRVDTTSSLSAMRLMVLNTTTNEIPTCLVMFENRRQCVAGDSRGNLALFNINSTATLSDDEINATDVCNRLHAKEHVNHVECLGDHRVMSVGNDGFLSECFVLAGGKLVRGISIPVPGLSSASKIWSQRTGGSRPPSLLVSGYFGNTFRVVDYTHGCELFSLDTGGRQRQLAHAIHSTSSDHAAPNCSVAICASRKDGRNDVLLFDSSTGNNRNSRRAQRMSYGVSLHGEPVYDLCLFATRDGATYTALLSGSEDCSVTLCILDQTSGLLDLFGLPPQESCVRAVAVSRRSQSSTSILAVGGGKLIMDFYIIEDRNTAASFCRDHIYIRPLGRGRIHDKADIDHRINAIVAVPINDSSHLVVTGDSNGGIYFFVVREEDDNEQRKKIPGIPFVTQASPILSLDVIVCRDARFLCVGTTAGDVSMWLLPPYLLAGSSDPFATASSPSPHCVYNAHQMGTNSICTSILHDDHNGSTTILIASVGDDQALTIVEVVIASKNCDTDATMITCDVVSTTTTPEACISALKGCHFVGGTQLVVVGYGQCLALWEWSRSNHNDSRGGGSNTLLRSFPIDVSDVNALAYHNSLVAVGGEGIELVELI